MTADLQTQPVEAGFFTNTAGTSLAWLGMAGAAINIHGTVLLIDPLISMRPGEENAAGGVNEVGYSLKLPLPVEAVDIPHADAVLYTHGDDDHFAAQTALVLSRQTTCRFLATAPVARALADAGIDPGRISTVVEGEHHTIGAAEILVTPALHDWQTENPWKRTDCCGYRLQGPDGVIWHPGDTRLIDDLYAVKGVDVMFFDIAAVDSHLGPEGSAKIAASCGAKVMIAYHYGTLDMPPGSFATCDPADALPFIEGLSARFLLLNPGEILHLPV